MGIDAAHRILKLHGEILSEARDTRWAGYFGHSVAIENLADRGDLVTFDLVLATSELDGSDYILPSEQARGTTDKVVLTQNGYEVAGARITRIKRTAMAGARDEYSLTFEVPKAAVQPSAPLEVRARWRDPDMDYEWIELAVATTP